jgi:dTDP-4-amino-4,6-dideoxygalactose transaminase
MLKYLNDAGIEALVHYPHPLPAMRFYREKFPTPAEAFATATRLSGEIITLPINPWIDDEDVRYVVSRMEDFFRAR